MYLYVYVHVYIILRLLFLNLKTYFSQLNAFKMGIKCKSCSYYFIYYI